MKLTDLKPCACCRGPLIKPPMITWYVIRVSQALLHPQHARETLALNAMLSADLSALRIAEALAPNADQAVALIAEQPGGAWDELHVCFDCYCRSLGQLAGLVEQANHSLAPKNAEVPA